MKQLLILIFPLSFGVINSQCKIYKGNSTSYSNCFFTFNDQKVYRGNSTSYSDCMLPLDGFVNPALDVVLLGSNL